MGVLAPWIIALSSVASTATQIAESRKKPPVADVPKPPEAPADLSGQAEVTARRMAEQRRRQAGQHGRASTIMSGSPLGQPAPPTSAKKYLTGA
jgi:hypothetical protein